MRNFIKLLNPKCLLLICSIFFIGCSSDDYQQPEVMGESKQFALFSNSNPAISGSVTFTKKNETETLVTIQLSGTSSGKLHPAHIHANTAAEGGAILIDLTSVDGASGKSETTIKTSNDGTTITYDQLLNFNGHINVHESASNLATIIAQGNIGSNVTTNNIVNYNLTNSGASAYIFNGGGLSNVNNPNLTLQRGKTYSFTLNTPGHPFLIKTAQTTGIANTYNNGVTNNGTSANVLTFTVPMDAPNTLYYICEFHSSMAGILTITN